MRATYVERHRADGGASFIGQRSTLLMPISADVVICRRCALSGKCLADLLRHGFPECLLVSSCVMNEPDWHFARGRHDRQERFCLINLVCVTSGARV